MLPGADRKFTKEYAREGEKNQVVQKVLNSSPALCYPPVGGKGESSEASAEEGRNELEKNIEKLKGGEGAL